jgi:hypothetical protein
MSNRKKERNEGRSESYLPERVKMEWLNGENIESL